MANDLVSLDRQLQAFEPRFDRLIPSGLAAGINAHRLVQTVLIAVEKTPMLLECTRESLILSVLTAANLGLPVDGVLGQAYMIPRKDQGVLKAQLQIGYKGFVTLGARASWILSGDIIYENDPHRIVRGTEPKIEHDIVAHRRADRGNPIWVYAVARSLQFPPTSTLMTIGEVEERRALSQAVGSSAPWKKHPKAMFVKTALLQLGRLLPVDLLNTAAAVDEIGDTRALAWIDDQGLVRSAAKVTAQESGGTALDRPLDDKLDHAEAP